MLDLLIIYSIWVTSTSIESLKIYSSFGLVDFSGFHFNWLWSEFVIDSVSEHNPLISVTSPQQQQKLNLRNLAPEARAEVEQLLAPR